MLVECNLTSQMFLCCLSFWERNCLCQKRIYQYVHLVMQFSRKPECMQKLENAIWKHDIWKMRCAHYSLGILLLLIVQVMSSCTGWGIVKLCFQEEENLLSLVSPHQQFHIVQPDSSLYCITVLQTSDQLHTDLHRL